MADMADGTAAALRSGCPDAPLPPPPPGSAKPGAAAQDGGALGSPDVSGGGQPPPVCQDRGGWKIQQQHPQHPQQQQQQQHPHYLHTWGSSVMPSAERSCSPASCSSTGVLPPASPQGDLHGRCAANSSPSSPPSPCSAQQTYNLALSWYWGLEGHGVDDRKAVELFEKSASMGHPAAQLQMGVFYKCGGILRQDQAASQEWFSKVREKASWFVDRAEGGDMLAMWQLSRLIAHNLCEAYTGEQSSLLWCRRAAEQGYALAQFDLSQCFQDGDGVPKDMRQASEWCRKAAEQHMVEAEYWLGYYYREGLGPDSWNTRADDKAMYWLREAGSRGHGAAQRLLGFLYTAIRTRNACKWLKNSRDNGSSHAGQMLKTLILAQQHLKGLRSGAGGGQVRPLAGHIQQAGAGVVTPTTPLIATPPSVPLAMPGGGAAADANPGGAGASG